MASGFGIQGPSPARREFIRNRPMDRSSCVVDVWLRGAFHLVSAAFCRPAEIDTGCGLRDTTGKYDIALVLPKAWLYDVGAVCAQKKARFQTADGTVVVARVYLLGIQVVGDNGVRWPSGFEDFPVIFLPRTDSALLGRGLWGRWKLQVDGPEREFSIWVPNDDI